MIIKCVICGAGVADVPLDEVVEFIRWLEKMGEIPVCFVCADRMITNLWLRFRSEIKGEALAEADRALQSNSDSGGER